MRGLGLEWCKMKFEINLTWKAVTICLILAIASFCIGYFLPRETNKNSFSEDLNVIVKDYCFSEEDLNTLVAASYVNNGCEKLGLTSSITNARQTSDGMIYGDLVCVGRIEQTQGE